MTRKDYVLIAAALKEARLFFPSDAKQHSQEAADMQHSACCEQIANELARDNPRFDLDRFIKACGLVGEKE